MQESSLEAARERDWEGEDTWQSLRSSFFFPQQIEQTEYLYFCGNSLGLQPKAVGSMLREELEKWQRHAVEGHFRTSEPWVDYHALLGPQMSAIVGGLSEEVVVMNSLTVNLHLLMVSFYRPTPQRYKILIEAGAFPSDRFAVCSQLEHHGYDPQNSLCMWSPPEGEDLMRLEDLRALLSREGEQIALVLLGGVHYYTGQRLPIPEIVACAHQYGCQVGFDLAHAAGNVPLSLHDWDVDFAAWCSYKYLNGGPGGV
ncbi:MAG: kynureninase, partial [Myxococcota bacterium]